MMAPNNTKILMISVSILGSMNAKPITIELGTSVMKLPASVSAQLKDLENADLGRLVATRVFIRRQGEELFLHLGDFDYADDGV